MDHTLVDANIARRALSWLDGEPIAVEPCDEEICTTDPAEVPAAEVHATRQELVIQIDLTRRGARDIRVLCEKSGVLHVAFEFNDGTDEPPRLGHRRFDFADAFDVRKARASLRFGVLTVRVPRREAAEHCPAASTGRAARGYATGSA